MNEQLGKKVQASLKAEADTVCFSEIQSKQILNNVHQEVRRRSRKMMGKGRKILITAAAIAILGTITVIGGGKVVSYYSSTNTNMIDYKNSGEVKGAADKLGAVPKVVQQFSNGLDFEKGFLTAVKGEDESGVVIQNYDEIVITYGNSINMIIKASGNEDVMEQVPVMEQEIWGVNVAVYEYKYLFLPPDVEVSAADQALVDAGDLHIGYGSETEERETYRYAEWTEGGLTYNLSTFDDQYDASTLTLMAQEVITSE